MTHFGRIIFVYYDFAERCCDDIDVMTRALKICGCKKRPNIIRQQLEDIDFDKEHTEELINYMRKADSLVFNRAKFEIGKERSKLDI